MATEESTTSMDTTAPEMAPTPAPRTRPLSVASPISAPVTAPRTMPTAAKTKVRAPRATAPATRAGRRETLLALPTAPPLAAAGVSRRVDGAVLVENDHDVLAKETAAASSSMIDRSLARCVRTKGAGAEKS